MAPRASMMAEPSGAHGVELSGWKVLVDCDIRESHECAAIKFPGTANETCLRLAGKDPKS